MIRFYLTVLVALNLTLSSQAQQLPTLLGTVTDSTTGKPLTGATIIIDYGKNSAGTSTNREGRYAIAVPRGPRTVVVRYVGYVPFRTTVFVQNDTELNIKLPTVASQLEEVIITSKGYDPNVRKPLLGVSQINIEAIKRMPAALGEVDILRSLQMLLGVTSVGEAANGVNIRGGTTDQNLDSAGRHAHFQSHPHVRPVLGISARRRERPGFVQRQRTRPIRRSHRVGAGHQPAQP